MYNRLKTVLLPIVLVATFSTPLSAEGLVSSEGSFQIVEKQNNYDSLLSVWYTNNIYDSYENFVSEFIDISIDEETNFKESLPDSVYIQRLEMLATAVQLPFNDVVKRYIEVYTIRNRAQMASMMGLAKYYMPIFEQELDMEGIPDELKIIPIIESGLNPKAISSVGACGLWQFMLRTGKSYGLEADSFIDERYDPIKATKVACKFMKDLYKIYEDWTLVIAAYNCGPGNVNKAIKRAGDATTYWDIYDYLPRETRNHIPAFIAATYAYTFHKAHGIEPVNPPYPIATDTIMVNKMLHFDQITSTIDIPIEVIRSLNPQYKIDVVPAKQKEYTLILPIDDCIAFAENEVEIYSKDSTYLAEFIAPKSSTLTKNSTATSSSSSSSGTVTYKIKSGDNLGSIAKKYGTTANNLMRINGITDPRNLKIGRVIIVK